MEIGKVYKSGNFLKIPLSLPDIDSNFVVLEVDTQYFASASADIKTTEKANAYLESKVAFYPFYTTTAKENTDKYVSTYVPKSQEALSLGDSFIEAKGKVQYEVVGFFEREVATDPIKANAPKVKRRYPFGLNLKPLIEYLERFQNSKAGLSGLFESNGTVKGSEIAIIMALIYKNTKLPYWSVDVQKPTNVAYIKQPKPKEKLPELKIKQPVVAGDRQTTAFPINGFTAGSSPWNDNSFKLGHQLSEDETIELIKNIQELNYVSPQIPQMPKTGSIFLDEFYFGYVTVNQKNYENIIFGGFALEADEFYIFNKNKNNPILHENYGFHQDYVNNFKIYNHKIFLGDVYTEYDYERIFKINDNFNGVDKFTSLTSHYQNTYEIPSLATFPPIYYVGQGRFSCLQGNDPNDQNDKLGVGDTFTLNKEGQQVSCTLTYMYYAHDKKGEKVRVGVFVPVNILERISQGEDLSIPYYHAEISLLNSLMTDHVSYFDYRKTLKSFYVSEQIVSASSSVSVSPYQELKNILGEEYDDAFLAAVQGLDWMKISELQKQNPAILEPIKELIRQSYVRYVLQKAKNPEALQSNSISRNNSGKYFIQMSNDTNLIDMIDYQTSVLGSEYLIEASFYKGLAPKPQMALDDIPNLVSKAMGSFDAKWNENFAVNQTLTFQENKEPLLIQRFSSWGDIGDGEFKVDYNGIGMDNYLTYRAQTPNHWVDNGDYYHAYGGFKIMYSLYLVHLLNENKHVSINPTNHKKIFPLVLTDVGINYLRYMNRWGFFATPEEMHDTIKKLFNDAFNQGIYPIIGRYSAWLFTSLSTNRTLNLREKIIKAWDAIRDNRLAFKAFLDDKDAFCTYMYSLPIDWGNIDASYMEEAKLIAPSKPTRKKRQPKAATPTTDGFEWTTGLLDWGSQNMRDEFKQGYEITENDFNIGYREFKITKNGQSKEYRVLRFYPKIANKSNKYQKFSRDVYAEEVNVYKTDDLPNQHADLQDFVLNPDYDFSVIVPVDKLNEFEQKFMFPVLPVSTTPPAPTTGSFKWVTQDWMPLLAPTKIEELRGKYSCDNDFNIQYCNFAYNGLGYYMIRFMPSQKGNVAYSDLIDNIEVFEGTIKYKTNLTTIPELQDKLTDSANADVLIFIPIEENYLTDFVDILIDTKGTITTPPTPPAPTSNFKWTDTPWSNFLRESYLKSFIEYYGGNKDGQIVTASFKANYPTLTDPKKAFFIVGFASAGAGKEYRELQLKLAKYMNKIDVLALHDNYGNEFTDAVNNYQDEFDDLCFFDADDYLDVVDLLLYRGTATTTPPTPPTPPAPPTPPSPKPTKAKTTKTPKPKKPDLSSLRNIGLDDI